MTISTPAPVPSIAAGLAQWAADLEPGAADLELAQRSLQDTVAVALAARGHPVVGITAGLPDAARWAAAAHVLDFDDLHMASTAHISAVCVPAVLASGGTAGAYLAGAGVMARLGAALGWPHYAAGWHATCTAGAPAAAVAAGVSMGLGPAEVEQIVVRTPEGTLQPLIHPRSRGGLEGKFSLRSRGAPGVEAREESRCHSGTTCSSRLLPLHYLTAFAVWLKAPGDGETVVSQ